MYTKVSKIIIFMLFIFSMNVYAQSIGKAPAIVYEVYALEDEFVAEKSKKERKKILVKLENLTNELKENKHYNELERVYVLLIENTNSKKQKFEYYMSLGEMYESTLDYPSSLDAYRNARSLYKKDEKANMRIGEILFKSNLLNLAEKSFLDILSANKNSEHAKKRLGDINFQQSNFSTALEYYQSLKTDYDEKDKIIKSAICHRELNDAREAIRVLEVYLQKESKDVDILFLLGKIFIYERMFDSAEKVFLHFADTAKENFIPYLYLASIYEYKGNLKKADEYAKKSKKLNKDIAVIDFVNAKIACKMNKISEAKQYAKNAYSKAKTPFIKEQSKKLLDYLNSK